MNKDYCTIASICRKGGVGKTTTAAMVSSMLADKTGCRVLVIDCDGQNSLTDYLLRDNDVEALRAEQTASAFFDDALPVDPSQMIHKTIKPGLHIVPSNESLGYHQWPNIEDQPENRTHSIRRFVESLGGHYPFILIDTGPTLRGLPNFASLVAADYVYSPIKPDMFSGKSMGHVLRFIKAAQEHNPELHMLGFLVNMINLRLKDHCQALDALRELHGEQIFTHVMPLLSDYEKSINRRQVLHEFSPNGKAASSGKDITIEIYEKVNAHRLAQPQTTPPAKEAA